MNSDFRRRWGLSEPSIEDNITTAIYRIRALIGDSLYVQDHSKLNKFAFIAAVPLEKYIELTYEGGNFNFKKYFSGIVSTVVMAEKLECILVSSVISDNQKDMIVTIINNENVGIRIGKDKRGKYVTYPQGEPMLDEKVVERTLLSLDGESANKYEEALKAYASAKWNESSNATRLTLEEYLRQYLNNTKGLQANINIIGGILKKAGIADHFRSSIINQLRTLDSHYNSGSKHGSNTQGAAEAEYLIYSVGVIVNTLEQLKISDEGAL